MMKSLKAVRRKITFKHLKKYTPRRRGGRRGEEDEEEEEEQKKRSSRRSHAMLWT